MSERDETLRDRDEAARDRDEAARTREEASEVARVLLDEGTGAWWTSRRVQGQLFLAQIVLNIVVLGALLALMLVSSIRISDINQRQIEAVKVQNETQICSQHDIVIAVRKIGVKLGLPVEDIRPPSVEGLPCATP